MGYTIDEARGQHHRMFVEEQEARGAAYRNFWQALSRGEFEAGEYKRLAKGEREVWLQATYNPIFDLDGKPHKVVKYAVDVALFSHTFERPEDGAVVSLLDAAAIAARPGIPVVKDIGLRPPIGQGAELDTLAGLGLPLYAAGAGPAEEQSRAGEGEATRERRTAGAS